MRRRLDLASAVVAPLDLLQANDVSTLRGKETPHPVDIDARIIRIVWIPRLTVLDIKSE
jgi:hypothetical protein